MSGETAVVVQAQEEHYASEFRTECTSTSVFQLANWKNIELSLEPAPHIHTIVLQRLIRTCSTQAMEGVRNNRSQQHLVNQLIKTTVFCVLVLLRKRAVENGYHFKWLAKGLQGDPVVSWYPGTTAWTSNLNPTCLGAMRISQDSRQRASRERQCQAPCTTTPKPRSSLEPSAPRRPRGMSGRAIDAFGVEVGSGWALGGRGLLRVLSCQRQACQRIHGDLICCSFRLRRLLVTSLLDSRPSREEKAWGRCCKKVLPAATVCKLEQLHR